MTNFEDLSDMDIWTIACGAVAIAGKRATVTKRMDVNLVCMRFVNEMAKLVGTPNLPEKFQEKQQ